MSKTCSTRLSEGNVLDVLRNSVDPSKMEYKELSSEGGAHAGLLPPSTLYVDITFNNCFAPDGTASSFGPRLSSNVTETAFVVKVGSSSVGFAPASSSPLGFGLYNLYYQPGRGFSLGWISLTSAPDPLFLMAASGIVLLDTSLKCKEHCEMEFASDLLSTALPINALRELAQLAGIRSEPDICKDIRDGNAMQACLAYSSAYIRQGLFDVAYHTVEKGLARNGIDPLTRADLMFEMDEILRSRNGGGVIWGVNELLENNITGAITFANEFIDKNEGYLLTGRGDPPSYPEIEKFMGVSLYLFRKMNMAAEIDDDEVTIKASAPVSFSGSDAAADLMEAVSRAYDVVSRSRGLWMYASAEMSALAGKLTEGLEYHSTEAIVSLWHRYNGFIGWKKEVLSRSIPANFRLRQGHLAWKIKEHIKDEEAASSIDRILRSPALDSESMRATAFSAAVQASDPSEIEALDEYKGLYDGLAFLVRMSEVRDALTDSKALYLTPMVMKPLYHQALAVAADAAKVSKDEKVFKVSEHIERIISRIVRDHSAELEGELKDFELGPEDGTVKDMIDDIKEEISDVEEVSKSMGVDVSIETFVLGETVVRSVKRDLEKESANFFAMTRAIRSKWLSRLNSEKGLKEKKPDYLIDRIIYELSPEKGLKKAVNSLARAESKFRDLMAYRQGIEVTRAYLKHKGGNYVPQGDQNKR